MSSQRRILASQRNGRKSKGPISLAGKDRSSRNAIRHGLLSNNLVLESENQSCFDEMVKDYNARFKPVDEVEHDLVAQMIAAAWRLQRCWAIETRTLDNEISAQIEGDQLDRIAAGLSIAAETTALPTLHRYETRLQMMHQRALKTFLLLRQTTPAPEPNDDLPNEPNPKIEHGHVMDCEPLPEPPYPPTPDEPGPLPLDLSDQTPRYGTMASS